MATFHPLAGGRRDPIWWGALIIVLFNGALAAWILLAGAGYLPTGRDVFILVDNIAQWLGILLAAPLCFGSRPWRRRGATAASGPAGRVPVLLGLGLLSTAAGQIVYTWYEQVLHQSPPYPSLADALFLGAYPFLLAAVLLLPARAQSGLARSRLLLDGLMLMTAAITVSWHFLLGPRLAQGGDSPLAVAVSLAFPLADLVLLGCLLRLWAAVDAPALHRVVALLSLGLAAIIASDTSLAYQTVHGGYATGGLTDVGWPLGFMTLGLGGWALRRALARGVARPADASPAPAHPWLALLPYALVPAVAGLAVATWQIDGAPPPGVLLGGAALVGLVVLRQALVVLENQRLHRLAAADAARLERLNAELRAAHDDLAAKHRALAAANARLEALATTDPLTELPNHRAIVAALDREIERARRYGRSCAVLFFDLDHFKALNDSYGHAAGDAVLREVAVIARGALRGVDLLGRWGGEEFVAILPEVEATGAQAAAERVRAAVAAHTFAAGGGMHLTCSVGVAVFPADADDRAGILAVADRAMYAAKRLGRNQARQAAEPAVAALFTVDGPPGSREEAALIGTVEALAALVEARDHYNGEHGRAVARLAMQLALALGLEASEARMLGLAGRLHDIGKVAVPDAILDKTGQLTEVDWVTMRRHPLVGADVVSRVPALRVLAPVIRAHHERWDGTGYPDGLAGAAIPRGARILAVADAFVAMTSDRPYRAASSRSWALAELRRCAGRQFDPAVVAALEHVLAAEPAALGAADGSGDDVPPDDRRAAS
jgi:two-component system cell cycle response regulator